MRRSFKARVYTTIGLLVGLAMATAPLSAKEMKERPTAQEIYKIICANPADVTQKMLCEHEDLRKLDLQMRAQLDRLMSAIGEDEHQRAQLKYSQERFAHVRRLCMDSKSCLKRVYESRLKTLKEWDLKR